ncbi:helix-turn-helix domain-containing protein [Joostella atrarenae]|uniref:Helix-turn-helix domain-containing protein n=1 Tax=Joostella atrarenae TaxID=679257 RepID=A0ABS9J3T3_9FLAO|nr:helix-turn-helix domain-containing protein [Joostella atrarenae]MCF8715083.1 helix-turn-helix domain-containing protein [Joostella atrarenae]
MAVQDIITYGFNDIFNISIVDFDKACLINESGQLNTYTIYWIKEGKADYNIDFKTYAIDKSVIFFLSPGQIFSVDNEKIKTAYKLSFKRDFYCIQTHDKEVSCNGVLFNNLYETPFVSPSEEENKKLQFIIDSLLDELKSENTGQYDLLQAYLKQFIVNSVRIKKEITPLKTDEETVLFKEFSLLVEQFYKEEHTVTSYANRLGISPKSLTKHFQRLGFDTPSDIIKNRIILEAKRQLSYTNNSVKEIAFMLGFNDPAYFTRFFKKALTVSPLQYRNKDAN